MHVADTFLRAVCFHIVPSTLRWPARASQRPYIKWSCFCQLLPESLSVPLPLPPVSCFQPFLPPWQCCRCSLLRRHGKEQHKVPSSPPLCLQASGCPRDVHVCIPHVFPCSPLARASLGPHSAITALSSMHARSRLLLTSLPGTTLSHSLPKYFLNLLFSGCHPRSLSIDWSNSKGIYNIYYIYIIYVKIPNTYLNIYIYIFPNIP